MLNALANQKSHKWKDIWKKGTEPTNTIDLDGFANSNHPKAQLIQSKYRIPRISLKH